MRTTQLNRFVLFFFYIPPLSAFSPIRALLIRTKTTYVSTCAPPRPHAQSSEDPMIHLPRYKAIAVTSRFFLSWCSSLNNIPEPLVVAPNFTPERKFLPAVGARPH